MKGTIYQSKNQTVHSVKICILLTVFYSYIFAHYTINVGYWIKNEQRSVCSVTKQNLD